MTGKRRAEKRKDFSWNPVVMGRAIRTVMPFRVSVSFCLSSTIPCSGGTDDNGVAEPVMSHLCSPVESSMKSFWAKSTRWQCKPCEGDDFGCRVAETDQRAKSEPGSRYLAVIDFRSVKNRA